MTSIGVIGLYLAFAIPIWLRWRHGDAFEAGRWTNGAKYKWMNRIAVAEIVIISFYLMLPFVPAANPFNDDVRPGSPSTTRRSSPSARCSCSSIWWEVSAKNWFTGPKHTSTRRSSRPSTT